VPKRVEARCSFCGKTRAQVDRLVAGPGVFICDWCVSLCNEIISEVPPATPPAGESNAKWVRSTVSRRPFWRRLFRAGAAAPV